MTRIRDLEVLRRRLRYRKTFATALGASEESEVLYVKLITSDGEVGYGEACPAPRITGETVETCEVVIRKLFEEVLRGAEVYSYRDLWRRMERTVVGNPSAKAALDMAVHDLRAKYFGQPLWKVLGTEVRELETDLTISLGDVETMVRDAEEAVRRGFRVLKVKVGEEPRRDVERIRRIREVVGPEIKLRIDANQGWDRVTAVEVLREVERYGVEVVEQPVPYWDLEGLRYVRERVQVPVLADESVHIVWDLVEVVRFGAVDGVNIKLMKCGGVTPALQLVEVARAHGLKLMFGCMGESRLAITAAACVAAVAGAEYIDLDSPLLLVEDPVRGGVTYEGPRIVLPEKSGLGAELVEST